MGFAGGAGLKPLNVVQPEGPSFEVHGNEISWQKWKMRMSFNFREGLVLHNIGCAHNHLICRQPLMACDPQRMHSHVPARSLSPSTRSVASVKLYCTCDP